MARPSIVRLHDIIDAIDLILTEMEGVSLSSFEENRTKQWVVERGLEIISEASRHLSLAIKERHLDIAWDKIAGIGNILRHEYGNVAPKLLWRIKLNDLGVLRTACKAEIDSIAN